MSPTSRRAFLTSSAAAAAAAGLAAVTPIARGAEKEGVLILDVVNHGIEGGDTDHSSAIQALVDELSNAGGGVICFPESGAKPFYRMQNIVIPANVWLWQQGNVSFRLPTSGLSEHPQVLQFGEFSTNEFAENVGCIGRLRVDISDVGAVKNAKAIQFFGIKGGWFPWIDVVAGETEQGTIFFTPNGGSEKLVPTNVRVGLVTCANANHPGNGAIQFTGGKDLHIGTIHCEGAIAARIETDAGGAGTGGIENLRIDNVVCVNGQAAFSLIPHENFIKGVHIGTAVSRGCSMWCYVGPGGGALGAVTVESGECDGTGGSTEKGSSETGDTEGLFVGLGQEYADFTSPFHVGSLLVKNVSGTGVWGFPNLHIGSLTVETPERYGVQDATGSLVGSRARIDKVKIINPCGTEPSPPRAFFSGHLERWDIGTFEAEDTRGSGAKMAWGIEAWGETTVAVENLRVTGATEGAYIAATGEARVLVAAPVERGIAKLSSGKATVTAPSCTSTSVVIVNTIGGAPVAVGVTERRAGSFVIEAAAQTSTAEVAWFVWPA
jgi:hypothetical protein